MKNTKKLAVISLTAIFLLAGCSPTAPNKESSEAATSSVSSAKPSNSSTDAASTASTAVPSPNAGLEPVTPSSSLPSETIPQKTDAPDVPGATVPSEVVDVPDATAASDATAVDGTVLQVQAQSAVLYDCASQKIIASKNEKNLVYPASTVKLMTALLALEHIPLDTVITVGDELDLVPPHSSLAYLAKGQQLTMDTLLHGILIPSGNDAAYVIATHTGRQLAGDPSLSPEDAVSTFVGSMNARCKELGMEHTAYTNPDGFDDVSQKTTAADLVKLAAEIVKHPELTAITRLYQYQASFSSGEVVKWTNTNQLLNSEESYYIPECIGLKTGSTEYSGYSIVSAYEHNGNPYVIVVMNGAKEGRWADSRVLYDYIASAF